MAGNGNPTSLANLRPWQKGDVPNPAGNPRPGPKIAPAMHKYATWSFEELEKLAHSGKADQLPIADVIAITSLLKAARDVDYGDKAREFVAERMDGAAPKIEVNVQTNVQVVTRWDDGETT